MDPHYRYPIISVDCHAGGDLHHYREYLESKWHDEFDAWVENYVDPWSTIGAEVDVGELQVGASSGLSILNWDTPTRLKHLEADGVCGEVLFPNTPPPFTPAGTFDAPAPATRSEYQRRAAGLRAYNRWLVDFCAEMPGRRVGVGQVFFNDIDDARKEITWMKEVGLTGGVQLGGDTQTQLVPLYYPRYDAIWELCEELEMPLMKHSTLPGDIISDEVGIAGEAIGMVETRFFTHRALHHLILAGVFDRFPKLNLVFVETGVTWVPEYLRDLDALVRGGLVEGTITSHFMGKVAKSLKRLPSEYFADNCYVTSSYLSRIEAETRNQMAPGRLLWGNDYPHAEGTYPYSRVALRSAFHDADPDEIRSILCDTPAKLFGFDLSFLGAVAEKIQAPTVEELSTPPDELPKVPDDTMSPAFNMAAVPAMGA